LDFQACSLWLKQAIDKKETFAASIPMFKILLLYCERWKGGFIGPEACFALNDKINNAGFNVEDAQELHEFFSDLLNDRLV